MRKFCWINQQCACVKNNLQLQRVDIYPVMFVFSCCRISSMLRRWLFSVSIMERACFRPTYGMRRLSSGGVTKEKTGRDSMGSACTARISFVYTTLVKLLFIIWYKVFHIKYALWTIGGENFIVLCESFTSLTFSPQSINKRSVQGI